ncbi:2-polyprenylphenol 6-hydroxylase [Oleispirillum naphthae]|uniref:2-polyprenylphenol 6-hydroxylase n=1 Tax=Oleispirillum naphthae TaxID=2838853 RepID=UPI0030824B3F
MLRTLRNTSRLITIARVLARHDALFLLDRLPVTRHIAGIVRLLSSRSAPGRPGERLARALVDLGPSFIKFGQALSTRADLVGDEVADDLSALQDRLAPFPFAEVRAIVAEELGAPIPDLFSEFAETPVAAASVAQVHRAVTKDGRTVAVKVIRPGVEAAFDRDIDLLFWLAEIAERAQPSLRRLRPVDSVETFERTVAMEMDLRFEAAAASELGENFIEDETFRVPEVIWALTGKSVLTTAWIEGIPIDERGRIAAAGFDPKVIAERAARAFFTMVFSDGFFHGDMHPGNLFVGAAGEIIAVDFGIMGRIDAPTRRYLGEMLLAFLRRDYHRAAEMHFEAGYVPQDRSVELFAQACRSIAEPIFDKPASEISLARLLSQLFKVTETFGMEVQPQLLILQKTMLTAEGVGRSLCPDVNFWELARPLVEAWMAENVSAPARLRRTLEETLSAAATLPRLIERAERISTQFTDDGLKLHPDTLKALLTRRRTSAVQTWLPWALIVALFALLVARR